jgi:hypothetical protein
VKRCDMMKSRNYSSFKVRIPIIGGKKTGDDRWYKTFVPLADKLYDEHLAQLEKEGLL